MASFQFAQLVLGDTWQERIGPGLQVTVIGMTVVFAVLILLYGILVLVGKLAGEGVRPKDAQVQAPAVEPEILAAEAQPVGALEAETAIVEAPVTEAVLIPTASETVTEGQLVAAIAAALAAGMAEEPQARPRSQTPVGAAKLGWTLAGRMELLTAREQLPRG